MTIQVSPVLETGISAAGAKRAAYWAHLCQLAQQSPATPPALQGLRDRATLLAAQQTFPSNRDEEWRFTDLSALLSVSLAVGTAPVAVSPTTLAPYQVAEAAGSCLVFVNGQFAPEWSATTALPPGVWVGNWAQVPQELGDRLLPHLNQIPATAPAFTHLNTAGLQDLAVIYLPKNQVVEVPIHLLFVTTGAIPTLVQPRCLLVAEPNSAATLVETHTSWGDRPHFTNAVTELCLGDNAQVNHTRVQQESAASFQIAYTHVTQGRTSRYSQQAIELGGILSRHTLELQQSGEQTETHLDGLTYLQGQQTSDTHSAIALQYPHSQTRQLHKTIVDDRAHAIFNGKVVVGQAAQLTDAGQLNRNLLLSSKARIDAKPQLEIVADNVKCTHGSTVGQLDADEVFYLQSRGIDADSARQLLIYAFAYEVINKIPVPSLRQRLLQGMRTVL